jgi:phosphatidylglycerophosphate synthase
MEQRWQPRDGRLTHSRFVERFDASPGHERVFNTRLLVKRSGLEEFVRDSVPLDLDQRFVNESTLWQELWRIFEGDCQRATQQGRSWRYISEHGDIPRFERWLLRGSGKSRDGFVSRCLNRPISRAVSQLLLKTPMTPNFWTLLITLFPVLGFLFLIRGDYFGFVVGAVFYQVHSILDGCDGEIARARNLVSESGRRLDTLCDTVGNLLLVIGVGLGLRAQYPSSGWIYAVEGIFCAVLIAANELFLRIGQSAAPATSPASDAAYYPRHREMIERSGLHRLGPLTRWIAQLTRRDVVTLLFLLLAIVDLAPWILHLWTLFAATSLVFSGIALAKPRR